ncbi:hypothetical protein BYT27DRAFT_7263611 [Phlegmacium glaucopus]|nr:hypothetical protein BYT27DRAFT_7263611 [Phlegmacium glaucopus]
MFTTPKKALNKLCAHPYLSPFKLFGVAETPTVLPVSGPGGHSVPRSSSFKSRLSTPPPRRKRHGAFSSLPKPKPSRPVGKAYHRVGMRRTASRQPLHMRRSIRNLGKDKAARDSQFAGLSRVAFNTAKQTRAPLDHEEEIFLKEFRKLGVERHITTGLAEARAAADRAAELAPLINAEREAKGKASLAQEEEQRRAFATQRKANATTAEQERLYKATRQAHELFIRQQREERLHRAQEEQFANHQRFFQEAMHAEELRQQAERDRLAREQESHRRNEEIARLHEERRMEEERTRLENERLARELEMREQEQREEALRRAREEQFADHQHFRRILQEARHAEELRQQAERDRLAQELETNRRNEEIARLREEREARRIHEERTRLENERLAQEQRDAQAFIDAALRFQQEAQDRLQWEQAARLHAEQEARSWFDAAQQAEMAANHARTQWHSRGFDGVDASMRDASMFFDMDASMRTAAPYSPSPSPPPSPPPLTVADRFALYESKWAALKSSVPVLSFELLPWPTLHDVFAPEDITTERMVEFFYHNERPGYEKKTRKECNRIELLRWHPDKFLIKVLDKVVAEHHAIVEEAAGQVIRFLLASGSS